MIRLTRASLATHFIASLLCLTAIGLLGAPVASAAEGTITYKHEAFKDYEKQLAAGEIKAVTINKRVRSMHITLNNGTYVLTKYNAHEEPKVAAALAAKGITVAVLSKEAAAKEVKKPGHKLRYIAGGVVLVIIIAVGAVLIIRRRRESEE